VSTADVEKLLRLLAPHELRGVPLYIVRKADVPEHLGGACGADGWTSPTLDLQLRPVIAERWRGRGVCLVASGEGMGLVACAVHELAHALDRPTLYAELPTGFDADSMAEHTRRELTGPALTAADVMVSHHSPHWCRLALHIACRAGRVNCGPALADVFGYRHLVPFAYHMGKAIEDEIEHHLDAPLSHLDGVPLPAEFLDLWNESAAWCYDLESRDTHTPEPNR
jgi:hypothetical protein